MLAVRKRKLPSIERCNAEQFELGEYLSNNRAAMGSTIEVNRQDANEVAREEREKTLVSLLDDVCLYVLA